MICSEGILLQLQKKGLKITPQRRVIVEDIIGHGGETSAQDLFERLAQKFPNMSLDTVYRNLNSLCKLGILYRMDMPGKASSKFGLETGHHAHYVICLACGNREKLDYCCLDEASVEAAEKNGFEITAHKLEFYGYCNGCKGKNHREVK